MALAACLVREPTLDEFDQDGLYQNAQIMRLYSKREVSTHGKGIGKAENKGSPS